MIVIGILILLALIVLIYLQLNKKGPDNQNEQTQQMLSETADKLNRDLHEIRKEILENSGEQRREIQDRLDKMNTDIHSFQKNTNVTLQTQFETSQKIIKEVTGKLTEIGSTNKQVLGFAEQMRSLENILQNPKQRGVLGEFFLETLLSNVLSPNLYEMQYRFTNGEIVDAAIFVNNKVIPIDSKFSLEKYNQMMQAEDVGLKEQLEKEFKQDLKRRIDETAKYIRPEENTTDFAFMFIPAEGIYYNLLIYNVGTLKVNTQDLVEYAFGKHVIIVSPTSFYAYLETVIQGLKALKIEESVKEVIKRVDQLGKHLQSFQEYLDRMGTNLGKVVSSYNSSVREFKKVDKDVSRITEGQTGGNFEPKQIEKPSADEEFIS